MQLANLHARDWNILAPAVDISDDANTLMKMTIMADACNYQGFDPATMLKAFILR